MKLSSEARLKALMAATRAAIWEWNPHGQEVVVNDRLFSIIGCARTDFQKVTIALCESLCHPEDWKIAAERMRVHLVGQSEEFESTIRVRHRDGDWRWVLLRGMMISDDAPESTSRFIGTLLDITREVRLSAHL